METSYKIEHGDNLVLLATYPANCFDSIVTDPPYGLSFMNKHWDYDVPTEALWRECLRVLKPGGHLLAFGGSRTYHRMAVRIEDAGFELRDQIMWLYGSGFPKNANCQLKPAHEPIVLARKPFSGSAANCVQQHGTGYLRIDECRVPAPEGLTGGGPGGRPAQFMDAEAGKLKTFRSEAHEGGRWPANVLHDGSEVILDAFEVFGEKGQLFKPGHRVNSKSSIGGNGKYGGGKAGIETAEHCDSGTAARFFYAAKASPADRGKGNTHPTVKPTELMRYLCRLITPVGGLVLDPFAGSGSTGKAALLEGLRFVGIEREAEYISICESRLSAAIPPLFNPKNHE